MELALLVAVVVAGGGGWWWWRARGLLLRTNRALQGAWQEVEAARRLRHQALETFLAQLRSLGLVPQAQPLLAKAIRETAAASAPRAMAEADRELRGALAAAYRGLPRRRPEDLRQAQNALAEAEDELDLARWRYNDLVRRWRGLLARRTYRYLSRRLALKEWEFYLLPGEEPRGSQGSWG